MGKTERGLEVEVLRGCLGEPKRSSRRALGWRSWGCSANGMGSEEANGSGGGQPENKMSWALVLGQNSL